ncbi:MAG: hypothetical protein CMA10_04760 [Euryarchaeota archaeon]|nr:hypothetical protein [Euryarchaeota archaeon]
MREKNAPLGKSLGKSIKDRGANCRGVHEKLEFINQKKGKQKSVPICPNWDRFCRSQKKVSGEEVVEMKNL